MKKEFAFLIAALVASSITLIVTIAITASTANKIHDDYGSDFEWAMLTPAPAIAVVWTILDLILYRLGLYHCVYWLSTTAILLSLNVIFGGSIGIALYYNERAWVAGLFQILLAVFYGVSMSLAAITVRRWRRQRRTGTAATTFVKERELSDTRHGPARDHYLGV